METKESPTFEVWMGSLNKGTGKTERVVLLTTGIIPFTFRAIMANPGVTAEIRLAPKGIQGVHPTEVWGDESIDQVRAQKILKQCGMASWVYCRHCPVEDCKLREAERTV